MDWLEVRVPAMVPWRPEVAEIVAEQRRKPEAVRSSANYRAMVDLRPLGIAEAVLHLDKRHGESAHKIQMIGTGQFSMEEHIAHLESIVDTDPLRLEPMRTDLTVDMPNVPVGWVMDHAAVYRKRFTAQLGKADQGRDDFMAIGHREIETLYCGKRPNCYRVYNKTAERRAAYARETRGWFPREPQFKEWTARIEGADDINAKHEALCHEFGLDPRPRYQLPLGVDGEPRQLELSGAEIFDLWATAHAAWEQKCAAKGPKPTFEQFCGLQESTVLTRFERQIGAQQVGKLTGKDGEPLFGSLRDLRRNLAEFNPFAAVSFSRAGKPMPDLPDGSNYSATEYMAGLYYRERVQRDGRQVADAWVRSISNGNGKKNLRRLAAFAPPSADGVSISTGALYERYRDAVSKQLAA